MSHRSRDVFQPSHFPTPRRVVQLRLTLANSFYIVTRKIWRLSISIRSLSFVARCSGFPTAPVKFRPTPVHQGSGGKSVDSHLAVLSQITTVIIDLFSASLLTAFSFFYRVVDHFLVSVPLNEPCILVLKGPRPKGCASFKVHFPT